MQKYSTYWQMRVRGKRNKESFHAGQMPSIAIRQCHDSWSRAHSTSHQALSSYYFYIFIFSWGNKKMFAARRVCTFHGHTSRTTAVYFLPILFKTEVKNGWGLWVPRANQIKLPIRQHVPSNAKWYHQLVAWFGSWSNMKKKMIRTTRSHFSPIKEVKSEKKYISKSAREKETEGEWEWEINSPSFLAAVPKSNLHYKSVERMNQLNSLR